MHQPELILTLAGALTAALVLGYLTQRLGLSPIVGYLIAGLRVGPYTPGFVANQEFAEELAEVGVVLLMFGVGLQFHLEELLRVRRVAVPGAIAGMVAAALLAEGLIKGDRIAYVGKNSDHYFELLFGAAKAGVVLAPIGASRVAMSAA